MTWTEQIRSRRAFVNQLRSSNRRVAGQAQPVPIEQQWRGKNPRIFCSKESLPDAKVLQEEISLLTEAFPLHDLNSVLGSMKRLVPEYNPENGQ